MRCTREAWIAWLLLPLTLGGCSEDKTGRPTATESDLPEVTAIMGRVVDTDGSGLGDVSVEAGGSATVTAADGRFELDAQAGPDVVVEFSRPGYLRGIQRVDVLQGTPTALEVTLAVEAAGVALDADAGGTVDGDRGAAILAPPAAFVDQSGAVVSGEVMVHLTPLDPAIDAEFAAYPGDLRARTQGGALAQLETFGVLDVTVRQAGEELQIADAQSVEIRIPAPTSGAATWPETVQLWSFDEAAAIWVEEGTASYSATEHTYGGSISHLSPWNADVVVDATCIRGTVTDQDGNPIPGARIETMGIDYLGGSSATADGAGEFCVVVRKGSQVSITAIHPLGGGATREVTSGTSDTSVPPVCGSCDDGGTWIVQQGSVTGPGGQQTDCAAIGDPYVGTCAEGMITIFVCFDPQGACTYNLDLGEIVYANGARMTTSGLESQMYGPTGELCGSVSTVVEGTDYAILYANAAGQTWTLRTTPEGDQIIECPDGGNVTLTSEQANALNACSGTSSQPAEECTVEGTGMPGVCASDADCPAGQICCTNIGYCMPDLPDICATAA